MDSGGFWTILREVSGKGDKNPLFLSELLCGRWAR
jgi:hypothetical protein